MQQLKQHALALAILPRNEIHSAWAKRVAKSAIVHNRDICTSSIIGTRARGDRVALTWIYLNAVGVWVVISQKINDL